MSTDLAFAPAIEQAQLVRGKQVSPVELVELYARRIERLNPVLNAWVTLALDRAMDEARAAEARAGDEDLPAFHGVPISIKDLNDTAGIRTTHGTATYADRIPGYDDHVVSRLRAAGFIVLGKTNTPEFGTTPWTEPPAYGVCRNPWDTSRTSGGSSGGAAVALAAGMCPVSQGSDGGGSIRIPASVCGLYGIKPSRGRVSAAPDPGSLLSQNGPISRTVSDAAALLDVMSGPVAGDAWTAPPPQREFLAEATTPPGRLRIAFSCKPPADVPVAPGNQEGVRRAAGLLSDLGHDVEEDSPEYDPGLVDAFLTIWFVGAAAQDPMPPLETLDPVNRALAELGETTSGPAFRRAWNRIERESRRIVSFFDRYDVLVTPTVASPPPLHGQYKDAEQPLMEFFGAINFVPFTGAWNSTGQPAATVPVHTDELGLPVGVQLAGRQYDEATLIRLSAQLEQAAPWAHRRPPGVEAEADVLSRRGS